MSSSEQSPEPTMDEILASIRRIIADEPTESSQHAAAPAGEGADLAEDGVVNDIARALSQGGDGNSLNGSGDDVLELTNEVVEPLTPSSPEPSVLNAEPRGPANAFPPAEEQPVSGHHPLPGQSAPAHEVPPVAAPLSHATHAAMPPAGEPPRPSPVMPQSMDAIPAEARHDPAFSPHPGQPPAGGPPPQVFADTMPPDSAPMNVDRGHAPLPGAAPGTLGQGEGGHELFTGAMSPPAPRVHAPIIGLAPSERHHAPAAVEIPVAQPPQPHHPSSQMVEPAAIPVEPAIHHVPEPAPAATAPESMFAQSAHLENTQFGPEDMQFDPALAPPVQSAMLEMGPGVSESEPETSAALSDDAGPDLIEPEPRQAEPADVEEAAETTVPEPDNMRENSFEKSVKAMLKPMLRDWLDDNMPRLLEGAMKDEMGSRGGKKGGD